MAQPGDHRPAETEDAPSSAPKARKRRRKRPPPPVRWIRGLRLPRRFRKPKPGSGAGIEPRELTQMPSGPLPVRITCIDYSADRHQFLEIENIADFIQHHRPEWSAVRWINVDGVTDMSVIRALAEKYRLHSLAIEDLLHIPQRPKVDAYAEEGHFQARLFIIARMIEIREGQLRSEQISIFLGHKTVLTFQETPGDVWDPIRQRLQTAGSQLRKSDASFLIYSLLDSIVDYCFPILEHYGDRLEDLEDEVLTNPGSDAIREIHRARRELLLLRRSVWPMRELILHLQREPHECFSDEARTYMRDVYDHTVHIMDIVETYREVATAVGETYMTAMSNRMNEIMKVLTIIGTIFIPLTFLAGVYGMNMPIPENDSTLAYPAFWLACLLVAGTMLLWFRRRGWL
jgi:magnesium transporter